MITHNVDRITSLRVIYFYRIYTWETTDWPIINNPIWNNCNFVFISFFFRNKVEAWEIIKNRYKLLNFYLQTFA